MFQQEQVRPPSETIAQTSHADPFFIPAGRPQDVETHPSPLRYPLGGRSQNGVASSEHPRDASERVRRSSDGGPDSNERSTGFTKTRLVETFIKRSKVIGYHASMHQYES